MTAFPTQDTGEGVKRERRYSAPAPVSAADFASAERAADKLRKFYAEQGKAVTVTIDESAQIITEFSKPELRAVAEPEEPVVKICGTSVRKRVHAFMASYQGRWFTAPRLAHRLDLPNANIITALTVLFRDGVLRRRGCTKQGRNLPKYEYSIALSGGDECPSE